MVKTVSLECKMKTEKYKIYQDRIYQDRIYQGYAILFDKIDKHKDIIPKNVKIYIDGLLIKNK